MNIFLIILFVVILIAVVFSIIILQRRKSSVKLTTDEFNLLTRKKFDRYELRSFLVRGDFNTTYEAYDAEKNKTVIIRVLHKKLIYNDNVAQQFQFKAEMLKYLAERYPGNLFLQNIRFGTTYADDEPRPFIVTDYIHGASLSEVLEKQGRLSPNDTLKIISQVGKAVTQAHSQRIWVRDLAPGNVILSLDDGGNLVVTLANIGVPFKNLPSDEAVQFKQGYYSPEDKKGDNVTEQSDVFALAALTYRMLEGFDLSYRNEGEPWSGVTSILENALMKEPYKRPSSVENFLKSLNSILTFKSSVKDIRWNLIIPNILKSHKTVKVKSSGQETISRSQSKRGVGIPISKQTKERVSSSLLTGLATAIIFWLGKKIESVLSSPKKFIMASVGGIVVLVLALRFLIFPPTKTTISVFTEPKGANVFVKGNPVGVSPLEEHSLGDDSGKVNIKVEMEGYFAAESSLTIGYGEHKEVIFPPLKQSGKLAVVFVPPDVTVAIDCDTNIISPNKISNLEFAVGSHKVFFNRQGEKSLVVAVQIKQGKNEDLKCPLKSLAGANIVRLIINSEPSGAKVFIDDMENVIDVTPYKDSLIQPGRHKLKVFLGNEYVDHEETISILAGNNAPIERNLTFPPAGVVNIISSPEGADIKIEDKELGKTTPLENYKVRAAKQNFKLTKDGYKEFDTTINMFPKQSYNINKNLIPIAGRIKIQVKPYGKIYINGQWINTTYKTIVDTILPAGEYKLKVEHPAFGRWEKTTKLKPDDDQDFSIDFDKVYTLTVTAFDDAGSPLRGDIYVDDKSEGKQTPSQIKVRTGQHKIEVRVKDYTMVNGTKSINCEREFDQPLKFTLKKVK